MKRALIVGVVVSLVTFGASAQTQPVVDVNGRHIILNSTNSEEVDWNNRKVEINSYWVFQLTGVQPSKSVCINATAFGVKDSIRAGRDFEGVHFDPSTMKVKSVSLSDASGHATALRTTSGMIKPLTSQDASRCVGAARKVAQ